MTEFVGHPGDLKVSDQPMTCPTCGQPPTLASLGSTKVILPVIPESCSVLAAEPCGPLSVFAVPTAVQETLTSLNTFIRTEILFIVCMFAKNVEAFFQQFSRAIGR